MSLGKRPLHHPMKRTTSMTVIILDPIHANPAPIHANPAYQIGGGNSGASFPQSSDQINPCAVGGAEAAAVLLDQRSAALSSMAWPMAEGGGAVHHHMLGRHSVDFVQENRNTNSTTETDHLTPPHFLRDCSLCKRRLVPGRDIYMYRGDSAFCSPECRQQQMSKDQREEKKCTLAKKDKASAYSSTSSSSSAKVSVKCVVATATATAIYN